MFEPALAKSRQSRLSSTLCADPLRAEDFFLIVPQDSQRAQYGVAWADMDWSAAEHMAEQPNSWTIRRGDKVLAILAIIQTFPGVQGVAMAVLAAGLGADHLAITRFARDVLIGKSTLARIEAIVRCAEIDWSEDPSERLQLALADPTPQVRWALDVGLFPVAYLRKFGAASEPHMLLERIAP